MKGKDLAYWLADKIPSYSDYAHEAAIILRKQADEIERLERDRNEWQPIDTAPKDGTEIIVCVAGTADVEFVRWHHVEWLDRTADPFDGATHWMSLPRCL